MRVPPAPPAFHWRDEGCGLALVADRLARHAQHLFTTKQLQLRAPDPARSWELVAAALGAAAERLVRVKQVHGCRVVVVRHEERPTLTADSRPAADAIVSNDAGTVLAVQVADCVPLLFADPHVGAAAAIHAGWRGTAARVTRETVVALQREFGAEPRHLVAAIGPSIGTCCYAVGPELIDAFRQAGASEQEMAAWFTATDASLRFDLWQANYDQLVAAGVAPENISVARLCTMTYADAFHSYRAVGARAGRMIAAIRTPARAS